MTRFSVVRKALSASGAAILVAVGSYTVSGIVVAPSSAFALSAVKNFSITSEVFASTCVTTPGAKLYPGETRCLSVTVHNPLSGVGLHVATLSISNISFTATPSNTHTPACTPRWLSVPRTLPAGFSVTPSTIHTVTVPIELVTKTATTQDNCENGTFTFTYTGSATYTDSTSTTLKVSGSGRGRTLKATVTPANPADDPYGPATAPVHDVVFYRCTSRTCATATKLATKTLTATGGGTLGATASTTVTSLSNGTYYFEAVYSSTGTHSGTFTTSSGTASTKVSVSTPIQPPPPPPGLPPGSDFSLTRADTPASGASVVPGMTISYSDTIRNSGLASGTATVTNPLGANETLSGTPTCATVAPGDTCSVVVTGTSLSITVNLAAGDAATVRFDADVTSADTTSVANTATITTGTCSALCAATVTNPVVVLEVAKSSSPPSGSIVPLLEKVTYTLTAADSGTAATTPVTLTDSVPAGTTYVPGSATCGGAPGCSVTEASGTLTWSGVVLEPGASNALAVSFQVEVDKSDTTGQTITNVAGFTNDGTPHCTTATCATNPVTLLVNAKASAASQSTPPTVSPIPQATTPHTGEPFAGSGRYELIAVAIGIGLLGAGEWLRRRQKRLGATRS